VPAIAVIRRAITVTGPTHIDLIVGRWLGWVAWVVGLVSVKWWVGWLHCFSGSVGSGQTMQIYLAYIALSLSMSLSLPALLFLVRFNLLHLV